MEDFDEAEEMNEEDLMELGDTFASLNLKVNIFVFSYFIDINRTMFKTH